MAADDTALASVPAENELATAATVSGVVLRPILSFIGAYVITNGLHELAHACAAYWLGVPSTLFHFYVDVDLSGETPYVQGLVRAAGPVFSLALGVLCWFLHRAMRGRWLELPLFYLAVFGVAGFLGSLCSAAFVGDFSDVAAVMSLSGQLRYAIAGIGLFLLIGFAFDIGRELREWVPTEFGAFRSMLAVAVLPAVVGTAAIVAIYQPLPASSMIARAGEVGFWIFAGVGVLVGSARPAQDGKALVARPGDWAFALLAVLMLRVMAIGIPFDP
jgi:hypothetical protein